MTRSFPWFSGRDATFTEAATAAPQEMPQVMPSSRWSRLAISTASSFVTCTTSSTTPRSRTSGLKPAPMPWILCGPGLGVSPARTAVSTGEWAGSTATDQMAFFFSFLRYFVTPVMVPPVPTPATKMSIFPSVSFQISGPVVSKWMRGLAGFSNWPASQYFFGSLATISLARAMAPGIPLAPSVRTSSAPKARSMRRRSTDMVSGMVRMMG